MALEVVEPGDEAISLGEDDKTIRLALPLQWVSEVWGRDLAIVGDRFALALVEATGNGTILETVASDLEIPRSLTVKLVSVIRCQTDLPQIPHSGGAPVGNEVRLTREITSPAGVSDLGLFGGRDRRRSGDLTLFRRALCQLSYPTEIWAPRHRGLADLTGFEPATSALTGRRALQAAPQDHGYFPWSKGISYRPFLSIASPVRTISRQALTTEAATPRRRPCPQCRKAYTETAQEAPWYFKAMLGRDAIDGRRVR